MILINRTKNRATGRSSCESSKKMATSTDTPIHRIRHSQRISETRHARTQPGAWKGDDADPDYMPTSDTGSDEMSSGETDPQPQSRLAGGETLAHETAISGIGAAISKTFLPTWLDRPPPNQSRGPIARKAEGRQLLRTLYRNTSAPSDRVLDSAAHAIRDAQLLRFGYLHRYRL